MTAAAVVLLAAAVVAGILFTAGAGLFALIVIPVGIAVAAWLALAGGSGRTMSDVSREVDTPEMFGPGGPDDPDRSA